MISVFVTGSNAVTQVSPYCGPGYTLWSRVRAVQIDDVLPRIGGNVDGSGRQFGTAVHVEALSIGNWG